MAISPRTFFHRGNICGLSYFVLLLSGEKRRRCERIQTGVLTPGTGTSTKRKPQRGDRTFNYFVNSILKTLSPLWGFRFVVALLPGVGFRFVVALLPGVTPPSVFCRLFETLGQAPLNCLSSVKPSNRRISRGALVFPRTAILCLFHRDSYRLAWFYFCRLDGLAVLFYSDGQFTATGTLDVDIERLVRAGIDVLE